MNDTVSIDGYPHKVTAFDSYDEAKEAGWIAADEDERIVSSVTTAHDGKYIILLYTDKGDSFYL